MKKILAFFAMLLMANPSLADPGIGDILDSGGASLAGNPPRIAKDGGLTYPFTTAVDSELFYVRLESELCFFPDTGGAGGSARITLFKAGNRLFDVTFAATQLPAIPFDGLECVLLRRGYHWIQVDTARTGGETPNVFIKTLHTRVQS